MRKYTDVRKGLEREDGKHAIQNLARSIQSKPSEPRLLTQAICPGIGSFSDPQIREIAMTQLVVLDCLLALISKLRHKSTKKAQSLTIARTSQLGRHSGERGVFSRPNSK